jgi:hypothetical protein
MQRAKNFRGSDDRADRLSGGTAFERRSTRARDALSRVQLKGRN